MKKYLYLTFALLLPLLTLSQQKEPLKVNVHPGVELFTIIQQLAGKYPPANPSKYSEEVNAWFSKYKDHPAVKKVASFDKTYTDLVELGWCMDGFPDIKIYEPAEMSWYKNYGKENVLEYLRLCRDFFNDTNFWSFYQQHQARYQHWGDELKAKVDSGKLVAKLQNFYRYNADVKWYICIDPLNSWGSHAIMTKTLNPKYSDWVVYNTGYFAKGATTATDPVFEFKDFENLVWHEGSHIYIQPLFEQYKTDIDALSYLYNKEDEGMKRNNITSWSYCLNENMVRGITAALYKKYRTERQYKKQLAGETVRDFIYAEDICDLVYRQYLGTSRYKDFKAYFPVLLAELKKKHPTF